MKELPRSLIILKPKQPFVDWLNDWDEECKMALDETCRDLDAILIPDCEAEDQVMVFVRANAKKLFEHALDDWCADRSLWPKDLSYHKLREWFDVEIHCSVFDAVELESEQWSRN
jgi:hypothetical protein